MKFLKVTGAILCFLGGLAALLGILATAAPMIQNDQVAEVVDSFSVQSADTFRNLLNTAALFCLNHNYLIFIGGIALLLAGGMMKTGADKALHARYTSAPETEAPAGDTESKKTTRPERKPKRERPARVEKNKQSGPMSEKNDQPREAASVEAEGVAWRSQGALGASIVQRLQTGRPEAGDQVAFSALHPAAQENTPETAPLPQQAYKADAEPPVRDVDTVTPPKPDEGDWQTHAVVSPWEILTAKRPNLPERLPLQNTAEDTAAIAANAEPERETAADEAVPEQAAMNRPQPQTPLETPETQRLEQAWKASDWPEPEIEAASVTERPAPEPLTQERGNGDAPSNQPVQGDNAFVETAEREPKVSDENRKIAERWQPQAPKAVTTVRAARILQDAYAEWETDAGADERVIVATRRPQEPKGAAAAPPPTRQTVQPSTLQQPAQRQAPAQPPVENQPAPQEPAPIPRPKPVENMQSAMQNPYRHDEYGAVATRAARPTQPLRPYEEQNVQAVDTAYHDLKPAYVPEPEPPRFTPPPESSYAYEPERPRAPRYESPYGQPPAPRYDGPYGQPPAPRGYPANDSAYPPAEPQRGLNAAYVPEPEPPRFAPKPEPSYAYEPERTRALRYDGPYGQPPAPRGYPANDGSFTPAEPQRGLKASYVPEPEPPRFTPPPEPSYAYEPERPRAPRYESPYGQPPAPRYDGPYGQPPAPRGYPANDGAYPPAEPQRGLNAAYVPEPEPPRFAPKPEPSYAYEPERPRAPRYESPYGQPPAPRYESPYGQPPAPRGYPANDGSYPPAEPQRGLNAAYEPRPTQQQTGGLPVRPRIVSTVRDERFNEGEQAVAGKPDQSRGEAERPHTPSSSSSRIVNTVGRRDAR